MRFGVLGPLTVWTDDGTPHGVPETKVRAVLAALLVEPGRTVSADRLIDALWEDRPPRNPAGTLQARVSQLRKVLDGAEPGARALVATRPSGYALAAGPDAVDAGRFAALLVRARDTADPLARSRLLGEALGLWRGPAFADFADAEFVRPAIVELEERRLAALEEHAETRLELGEHAALAAELAGPVAREPLRERLRAAHLRALHRAGRRGEALTGYHELRERLAGELGVDPSPELAELYQEILDDRPAEPVRPRPAVRLPVPLDELIGRDAAVARARDALREHRLVTLTGAGGVGKTRLAVETAGRAAADHPDGVWFVELAPLRPRTAADVAGPVARTLGLRDEPADPGAGIVDRLADALRGRRALLVLDNCEHAAEPVAELVARLLAGAPGLRILATSREPLGVPGERLRIVPPLDLPGTGSDPDGLRRYGAVRLFVARASAAAPGFALDAATAPWVASICRRLDGVPLALELAATRVRALGVRELAAALDDRFRVLGGARRGPERQRTLRATIDWSWGLLDGDERAALRRLAVHAGGCTAEAAAEVSGADLDVLARLVDRSLVARGADGRYRLLESIAAYGLERLREAGEEGELRLRHARHLVDLAERAAGGLRGPEQAEWLGRLDAEAAGFRAALEHAPPDLALRLVNALAWHWFLRGRFGEARSAFADVLASAPSAPSGPERPERPERREAETWLAAMTMASGESTDADELRRTALERYKATDGPGEFARAKALWLLSRVHWAYGDMTVAHERVNEALAVFRARADRWHTAAALATRAMLAIGRGSVASMRADAAASLEIFDALGDPWGRLEATDVLAQHAEITGDYAAAARLLRAGLRLAEDLGMWPEASFRLAGLGRVALLDGALDEARDLHERALCTATRHAARSAEEFAELGLGLVARARGEPDAAEAHLRAPLAWLRDIGGTAGIAFVHAQLGFIAEERGDADAALALHTESLAAARTTGDPRAVALALEGRAGARSLAGAHGEAVRLLREAAALRASSGAPLPPGERREVDRIAGRITDALGVSPFDGNIPERTSR
ncbi:BTAD domain-containing putative transcriptional regulator [Actinomadura sp. WMMB 499]|uniref:BTAD domain-containing putative transcriptional regulator n=1 Tax=Actinomadura sp. WMMB 499 TaxID=1219491 RepID=UPI0012470B8A|nr:BTAD domain-containing putative transcriptional regulator [Actinomadura sp. WMMB 499]QFG22638.1 tetratricopeptide repeat protein [Actinomadura sp. WMMB 499]